MKFFLSLSAAFSILLFFVGTVGLIWYASSNTEIKAGPNAEQVTP